MALTVTVQRGYTPQAGVPMTLADWLALALPTVTVTGAVGPNDLTAGDFSAKLSAGMYFADKDAALSAGVLTVTLTPAPSSYQSAMWLLFRVATGGPNTGAVDINVNTLGVKDLLRADGTELQAGDLQANGLYLAQYEANSSDWRVLTGLGNPAVRFSSAAGSVTAGTATAYTVATAPTLTALNNNAVVAARIHAANTGAATLAVDGLTAKPIRKLGNVALTAGDLAVDSLAVFVFNAALDVWLLASAPAPVWDVYATAVGAGSPTVYALTAAIAPPAYVTGMRIRFVADVANTGAAQVNLNAIGAVALKKAANVALATNDLKLGQVVEAVHDGTNFQLSIPAGSQVSLLSAYKTADESVATSTTLQDDDHLFFAMEANRSYFFHFDLFVSGASASPDFKFAVNGPAGVVNLVMSGEYGRTSADNPALYMGSVNAYEAELLSLFGAAQTRIMVRLQGTVENGATPGNLTLRWAQRVSNATPSTINRGSSVQAIQL